MIYGAFLSCLSVQRTSFFSLLELIKGDPIFISRGRKPQMEPKYQLATYLIRYGTLPGVKVSTMLQLSEGSIYNHSRRVVTAFRKLRPLYLTWPTPDERRTLRRHSKAFGFPGAIGALDGTHVQLLDKPRVDAIAYRSRKKIWSVSVQVSLSHVKLTRNLNS